MYQPALESEHLLVHPLTELSSLSNTNTNNTNYDISNPSSSAIPRLPTNQRNNYSSTVASSIISSSSTNTSSSSLTFLSQFIDDDEDNKHTTILINHNSNHNTSSAASSTAHHLPYKVIKLTKPPSISINTILTTTNYILALLLNILLVLWYDRSLILRVNVFWIIFPFTYAYTMDKTLYYCFSFQRICCVQSVWIFGIECLQILIYTYLCSFVSNPVGITFGCILFAMLSLETLLYCYRNVFHNIFNYL